MADIGLSYENVNAAARPADVESAATGFPLRRLLV
jgi:hypothetical protein